MKYALDKGHFPYELRTLPDGAEALAFIRREGKYADAAATGPDCDGPALAEERWNGGSGGDSRERGIRRSPRRRFEFLRVAGGEKQYCRVQGHLPHPETKRPGCVLKRRRNDQANGAGAQRERNCSVTAIIHRRRATNAAGSAIGRHSNGKESPEAIETSCKARPDCAANGGTATSLRRRSVRAIRISPDAAASSR